MTRLKRHEIIEAIRVAGLCGIAAGFVTAILPIGMKWQFIIAAIVAACSFAWDYRLIRRY